MSGNTEVDGFLNRDLSLQGSSAKQSSIAFAFDFPTLHEAFRKPDADAAAARLFSRVVGVTGVILVLAALMLASSGPLFEYGADPAHPPTSHGDGPSTHQLVGIIAAVMGLVGTALGIAGMGKGAPRHKWLCARLTTETLRLFKFHYLASRMPEIVAHAGDADWRQRFESERDQALAHLQAKLLANPDEELRRITKGEDETSLETFIRPQPASSGVNQQAEDEAMAAWRELRLGWQEAYVKTKLKHTDGRGLTARGKEHFFAWLGWTCVTLIIVLHLVHFLDLLTDLPTALLEVAVIWVALIALAGRALEDGFAPHREVERYEQYQGNIRVAIERFEAAQGFAAKLEVARAFERTSLEEMRVFIRTLAKTRFLL